MPLPTSLYIHIPWCVRKCPYCDFNSHTKSDNNSEEHYIQALIADLNEDLAFKSPEFISSIFIGGGTPSLFSPKAYDLLFSELRKVLNFADDIEITLEANPGTIDAARFADYYSLGINRLSIGIQSFNAKHLKILGRIHNEKDAAKAIEFAQLAGFNNINLDLMYGLPEQSKDEALADIMQALSYKTNHVSWYQLTIEPNTVFYKRKPTLPTEEVIESMEQDCLSLLADAALDRYEISAFCRHGQFSAHNMNYWLFGDYLGIGAGAHGKITTKDGVYRTRKQRQPKDYLDENKPFLAERISIDKKSLSFEFMLNALRLEQPASFEMYTARTGLPISHIMSKLQFAYDKGLIKLTNKDWQITSFGRRFTNDIQSLFLE